jgi:hypothetical protein
MKRFLWRLLSLGVGCLLAFFLLGSSGGRGFFSPDTLEYRSQSEVLLFVTEIPLYRSRYKYDKHELVDFLVCRGYWTAKDTRSPRWLCLYHWNDSWRDGESGLYRSLFQKRKFWIVWSEKNPQQAAELWPLVLDLLRSNEPDRATEFLRETALQS